MMQMIYRMRALYNVVINTVVTGYAYSMGAIVFQAGDRRYMGSFSTLMLHSPQWTLSGTDQQIFSDYAILARHYKNLVSHIFAQRSGKQDASGPAPRPGPHADQGKGPPMHGMASAAHVRDRGNSNPACSFTPECSIPPNAPCRDAAAPGADE